MYQKISGTSLPSEIIDRNTRTTRKVTIGRMYGEIGFESLLSIIPP